MSARPEDVVAAFPLPPSEYYRLDESELAALSPPSIPTTPFTVYGVQYNDATTWTSSSSSTDTEILARLRDSFTRAGSAFRDIMASVDSHGDEAPAFETLEGAFVEMHGLIGDLGRVEVMLAIERQLKGM